MQIIQLFSGIRNCFPPEINQINYLLKKLKDEYKEKQMKDLLQICKILDVLELLSSGNSERLEIEEVGRSFGLIKSIIENLESIVSVNSMLLN